MLLEHAHVLVPPPAFALPDGAHEAGRKHELVLDVIAPRFVCKAQRGLLLRLPPACEAATSWLAFCGDRELYTLIQASFEVGASGPRTQRSLETAARCIRGRYGLCESGVVDAWRC